MDLADGLLDVVEELREAKSRKLSVLEEPGVPQVRQLDCRLLLCEERFLELVGDELASVVDLESGWVLEAAYTSTRRSPRRLA